MTAAVVVECGDELGECPVWDPNRSELLWTDIHGRRLHRLGTDGSTVDVALDDRLCSFAVTTEGDLLAAFTKQLVRLDRVSGAARDLQAIEPDLAATRCNDGRPDRHGGFVFGTMDERNEPRQPLGSFHHWHVEHGVTVIRPGVLVSNGLCFSPDGLTIHYADSPLGTIWKARYDPGTGEIHDERVLVGPDPGVPGDTGSPDGSAVDAEGCIWNARWGAWGVARFTPDGALDTIIDVPVPQPSAVTFGGDDLGTLYITTGREHMQPGDARYELSGSLFAVTPGVAGIADTPVTQVDQFLIEA
ncbi:MAG: SMP-30/gluconolactonase/LRE family protein [Ilumatobacteraceae bacterium]